MSPEKMFIPTPHSPLLSPKPYSPNPPSSPPLLPPTILIPFLRSPPRMSLRFICKAAASVSGSGAEYPVGQSAEQLAGESHAKPKMRRKVAGADQEELLEPEALADPDSCFYEFNGVKIHHKVCHNGAKEEEADAGKIGLPLILLHGFGASVFSWDRVMKPLARVVGSKVLAFDRPAFGLTSRLSYFGQSGIGGGDAMPLNPYSMAFSVLATLSFIDLLGAQKAILMGHSAGCLVAVNTYFEAPERVAALILVAPAIVAPFLMRKENQVDKGEKRKDENSNLDSRENPFVRIWSAFCQLCMNLVGLALKMVKRMRDMVKTLYARALSVVLRSTFAVMLIRMIIDKFGIVAIRNAWFDANQVNDHVLQGYTKPLRAKGWETALLEYTLAMILDSGSKPPISKRLSEILCPVLIVTGDTDRLVPSWNAERLSRAIPNSTFEVIKNCGHLPHEEKVDEFLSVVERFLQRVFGVRNEELFEAAA
ncbi:uncharacterized protein LOC109728115 [Ananas comosus]|uniref:Uncharacterized protein LOC109728115 n=1 Tax=Ananas comosus TaxID=4615 RepID=A0A6P5H1U9_ANACO|nr:uncharacterized protein LOC109728115 [Ananas comosus]